MIDNLPLQDFLEKLNKLALSFDPETIIYLVGSYATKNQTQKSDIDILIINNKNKELAIKLKKILKKEYPRILMKLDCKIVSSKELNSYKNTNFLMLYTMIKDGKLLLGKEIQVKFLEQLIRKEFIKLDNIKEQINSYLIEKRNFNTAGCLSFHFGKKLFYLSKISSEKPLTLKEIFTKDLALLGRIYENETKHKKGILTTLTIQITNSNKKSTGNYERLKNSLVNLEKIQNEIKLQFEKRIFQKEV